jgi:hypothetical protein
VQLSPAVEQDEAANPLDHSHYFSIGRASEQDAAIRPGIKRIFRIQPAREWCAALAPAVQTVVILETIRTSSRSTGNLRSSIRARSGVRSGS